MHPSKLIRVAMMSIEEFQSARREDKTSNKETPNPSSGQWQAPLTGWYKANWDVGIDKANERMGVGIVVRNSEGLIMGLKSITKSGLLDPTSTEAIGDLITAQFCKELGIQDLIMEGDALIVVKEISNTDARVGGGN